MGTHIYNNNPSRRGRRMSIDLPNLQLNSLQSTKSQQRQESPAPSSATSTPKQPPPPVSSSSIPEIHHQTNTPPLPPNTDTDLFFRYLTPHLLNCKQFKLNQSMLNC